ncbi:MAG TPA: RNA 2',3'-cyclic phosphodiesterase [Candidatus Nitrosotalea sp.]|nr:RNA 2',3'-cyclic phosphodiesterase [Candidatus Nitrosotalea sp.]
MRTFVAVEICDKDALDSIVKLQSDLQIKASPVSRQNMHFTLLFLGEVTENMVEGVKTALSYIIFKPIQLNFTHLGAFPNPRFPRVIWIGVNEIAAAQLIELAAQVEQKLLPLGFKQDKPFKPHLTIFRVKNNENNMSDKIAKYSKISILGKDTVTELKFKQSVLTSNGPRYSDLLVVKAQ